MLAVLYRLVSRSPFHVEMAKTPGVCDTPLMNLGVKDAA